MWIRLLKSSDIMRPRKCLRKGIFILVFSLCIATMVILKQTPPEFIAKKYDQLKDFVEYHTVRDHCISFTKAILDKKSYQTCLFKSKYCKTTNVIKYSNVGAGCRTLTAKSKTVSISVSRFYEVVSWIFEENPSDSWRQICGDKNTYDIGLFPRHIHYLTNIYFFQMVDIGPLFEALHHSGDVSKVKKIALVLPVHGRITKYQPFLEALNISHIVYLTEERRQFTCFKQAVLPAHTYGLGLPEEAIDTILRAMNITNKTCVYPQVTIIQRSHSRRIYNVDDIQRHVASKFPYFSNVKIIHMENMTIQEQIQEIQCTNVLIGVQGAALSWLQFLPKGAYFIELWFDGWPSKYVKRANKARKDLHAIGLQCEAVTSDQVKCFNKL